MSGWPVKSFRESCYGSLFRFPKLLRHRCTEWFVSFGFDANDHHTIIPFGPQREIVTARSTIAEWQESFGAPLSRS